MTDDRQPPEKICDHFDVEAFCVDKRPPKCKVGVSFVSVSIVTAWHKSGAPGLGNVPCFGLCDAATCDKRELPTKPKPAGDPQRKLFD